MSTCTAARSCSPASIEGLVSRPTAPGWVPFAGAAACLYLAGPWARDSEDWIQYKVAGGLLLLGIVLWACTWMTNRAVRAKKTGFRDIEHLED